MSTDQVLSICTPAPEACLDDVAVKAVQQWETDFLQFAQDKHCRLDQADLTRQGDLTDEIVEKIEACINDFKSWLQAGRTV